MVVRIPRKAMQKPHMRDAKRRRRRQSVNKRLCHSSWHTWKWIDLKSIWHFPKKSNQPDREVNAEHPVDADCQNQRVYEEGATAREQLDQRTYWACGSAGPWVHQQNIGGQQQQFVAHGAGGEQPDQQMATAVQLPIPICKLKFFSRYCTHLFLMVAIVSVKKANRPNMSNPILMELTIFRPSDLRASATKASICFVSWE